MTDAYRLKQMKDFIWQEYRHEIQNDDVFKYDALIDYLTINGKLKKRIIDLRYIKEKFNYE